MRKGYVIMKKFQIGYLVKLNWDKGLGNTVNDEVRMIATHYTKRKRELIKWDYRYNQIHTITFIRENGWLGKNTPCYLLDHKYWFDEDELLLTE